MLFAQIFLQYCQCSLKVCVCVRPFSLSLCGLAQIAQNHRSVWVAWPMQRFDNVKRPVIVASRIPQTAQILQHVAQDVGPKGNIRMARTVDHFIDLQGSLKMELRAFCIPLCLQHSPQIVQSNGNMRMVRAVVGFFRFQVFLIVAAGNCQVIVNLIERPQAYGIPGGLGIDISRARLQERSWMRCWMRSRYLADRSAGRENRLAFFILYDRVGRFLLDKADPSFDITNRQYYWNILKDWH